MMHIADRVSFKKAIRQLLDEQICRMLSNAIEMMPPSKLDQLAKRHLNPAQLLSDGKR